MAAYADTIARPAPTLTDAEQRTLLKVTGQRIDGFRDHVIYSIALGTGLRLHEIVALNVGDLLDANGDIKRRIALRVFKRSAKDVDAQEAVFSDTVRAKLAKLLDARRRSGEQLSQDTPVFISRLGKRLSERMVRHAFAVWQERAGFERRFNFHALRHTACTNVYRVSKDIRLTQRFARHKSVVTTSIYTHPSDEELFRAVDRLPC